MANMMSRLYSNLAGCDFTNDPAKVSLSRSPKCINMYKEYKSTSGQCVETRPGLNLMVDIERYAVILDNEEFVNPIYGIYIYKTSTFKKILFHVGTMLYVNDYPTTRLTTQDTYIYNHMNNAISSYSIFDNKLYINDGLNYLVYDGTTIKNVSEDAFIPTTTISRIPSGGGKLYQDVNVLTPKRKNTFVADGESTQYYLDTYQLDDADVVVKVNGNVVNNYSVNRTTGCITFETAPEAPNTAGQDNVEIEFSKTGVDYNTRISNCTKNLVFDNRIFFTGNSQFSNAIFHCELNNPAYISDLAYYEDGTSESAIKSFCVGNNLLWVFKESSQMNDTIFYHTPTIDSEEGKLYPRKQGNISTGCVSECVNFNDDIVFMSKMGLEGITANIEQEQFTSHRSSLIDAKLINESNFESLQMAEWNGYLVLLVNNHIYIADSRQKYQGIDGFEYEWYYWEFDSVFDKYIGKMCYIANIDDELFIGSTKGLIYKFDKTKSTDSDSIDKYIHMDIGERKIFSCWQTPYDIFGDTNNLKTTNKRGGVAKIKTIPNGSVSVSVQTNRKPEKLIKKYSSTGFDFNNIDFNNFAFTLNDMSYIVYKIKQKKFIDLTLTFFSEDKPFGLYDATLEVYQGSYIKRT